MSAYWRRGRTTGLRRIFISRCRGGSDAVLKRMRRRYDSRQFLNAVDDIRRAIPDAAITTDVIAGFPGETESDFEVTYHLCPGSWIRFDARFPILRATGHQAPRISVTTFPRRSSPSG